MGQVLARLRPLSRAAVGLLLLIPVALYVSASLLKYAAGIPTLYDGLGFFADPQQLSWYARLSPILFLGGPLAAAALSLGAMVKLDLRRENDQVITTITFTPRLLNVAVAVMSMVLLAVLAGYLLAESLGHS
ncbi:MAG TPA: hypothetical protein VGJ36_07315 [Gemmatimonadales bacterium]